MSLKINIPKKSSLTIIGGIFKAVFNSPTIAKYDFTNYAVGGLRYNVAIDLGLQLRPNFLYFFHQMDFSLSIGEGEYLAAISPGTAPTLTVRDSSTGSNIFYAPFRMFQYFENCAVDSFYFNHNDNARVVGDFQSVMVQTADLVGISDIYAQVSFSVYEINDTDFINNYKNGKLF